MQARDPITGRFVPSDNWWPSFKLGGDTRGDEWIISLFLGVISLLVQAFEKAGFVFFTDFKIALALIPAIILISLAVAVIEERWQFLLGYWLISSLFFGVALIGFWELVFNFTFPSFVFLLVHSNKVNTQTSNDNATLAIIVIVGLVALLSFALSGWGQESIISPSTTTTVSTTTSTSSTSTSTTTSTTTTTIKPITMCLTDANDLPFSCSNPTLVTANSISFYMTQIGGTPLYNFNLACITAPMQSSITANQFYPLQTDGMPNLVRSDNGTTLQNNKSIHIIGWPCNAKSSTNYSFEGYIWVNFTPNPGSPIVNKNPWDHYRIFDIFINVTLPSYSVNQTKNTTS